MAATLLANGCTDDRPPATSELGRIMRLSDYRERKSAMERYIASPSRYRAELAQQLHQAGFTRGRANGCDLFEREMREAFSPTSHWQVTLCPTRSSVHFDPGF